MSFARRAPPGRIRVVGGSLRNSRIEVPNLPGLRPTPERVRETLFNWLAPVIDGARCMDLCAGTGALGIEALSRGASAVQFIENEGRAVQALRHNLSRLKVEGEVTMLDAASFLGSSGRPQDLVFLDPPFALDLWSTLAGQLERGDWLAARALIYVESPRALVPVLPANWQLHREGYAGEVRFALYRRAHPLS
ncbi:MAG: 16S rRNA (guanine(966)-N(2))-methyltransferase RsmD [Rhodanobacter sp.]